ncbi:TIGR00730 family Rossman fold protein, partial [Bacteroidota bacterium]
MNYKKVTVFCAASKNCDKVYLDEAEKLGKMLAQTGREIIYGGGKIGLMGSLADGALLEGGKITGIIPEFLNDLELGHDGITELREVKSLHERESQMLLKTDCIIALPGGIGTFSELLQAITWKRLCQINSKIIIVNI